MSTIKSSDEHLTLNADGSSKDIKFQANGVEKASISSAGAFTSTTIDATKLTGDLPAISGASLTGVGVAGISSSADATAITIDSAENVGFGVTPEPHNADWTGLDIGGMGTITGETAPAAGRQFTFNNNAYINTSGNWVYKHSSDEATQLQMFDGKFRFRTAPTGTADSNVTFTERLLITNDGRGLSQFTAKAWLNFNDTTINDSHNISSMTDIEQGMSYANFSNNMANTNYAVSGMAYSGNCDKHGPYIAGAETNRVKILSLLQTNCNYDDRTTHIVIFGD